MTASYGKSLADVPQNILDAVKMSGGMGNAVVTVAQWTKMLIVHMRDPLMPSQREDLRTRFPRLSYRRYEGDPHNPANELFFDDTTRAAIYFPLRGEFVR